MLVEKNFPPSMYVVIESVYSMDGDSPNLEEIVLQLCEKYNCYLVVDEAHAIGVFGDNGEGLWYKVYNCMTKFLRES